MKVFKLLLLIFLVGAFLNQAVGAESPAGAELNEEIGPDVHFFANSYDSASRKKRVIRAGTDLSVGFRIYDPKTGDGIDYLRPIGWLTPRMPGELKPDQAACETKVKKLIKGGISEADLPLNGFYILTLNKDNSIAIINPLVNVGETNILGLISLKGKVADWTLDRHTGIVYASLPDEGEVAVVDINARVIKSYLKVGASPHRLVIQPDGRYIWVGHDKTGRVSIINAATKTVVEILHPGEGPLDFSFDTDHQRAYVSATGAGRLSVIDLKTLKIIRHLQPGKGKLDVVYSKVSKAVYLSNTESKEIMVIAGDSLEIIRTIPLSKGVVSLHLTPDGKTLFALNRDNARVTLINVVDDKVLGTISTGKNPDHVLFTHKFAYIRNQGSVNITLIPLAGLDNPEVLNPVSIPVGVNIPGESPGRLKVSPMDINPDHSGALMVNPSDGVIFFYMEGMNAPMKSVKTFTESPVGLLVYDRSLKPAEDIGTYKTVIRLKEGGVYDVPFILSKPRTIICFELTVEDDPGMPKKQVPPLFDGQFTKTIFHPGEVSRVRFQLHDAKTGLPIQALQNVWILSFRIGSGWQFRTSVVEVEKGFYEAELNFPKEGKYHVMVSVPSLGIGFGDIRHKFARVEMEKVTMKEK